VRTYHAKGLLGRERMLKLKALEEKLGFKIFQPG